MTAVQSSASYAVSSSYSGTSFVKGGSLYNPSGITTTDAIIVWNVPMSCSLVKLSGYRVTGSSAEVNAFRIRGGVGSFHSASNLVLTTQNDWSSSLTVQNTSYVVGDTLAIVLSGSLTNSPTQIAVQLDFTTP